MVEEASERVKKFSEGVFTTGSRAKAPRENEISSPPPSPRDELLIAVIILGIIVFALILIIIYGYCKYVRRTKTEGRDPREDAEQPSPSRSIEQQQQQHHQHQQQLSDAPLQSVPVKTRKRSMTFSETDEECRKYREGLADTYNGPGPEPEPEDERSRKKSVVTFVGVKEIDGNDS